MRDERVVQFQRVHGITLQIAQRGIAGSEVVEMQRHLQRTQTIEVMPNDIGVIDEHALGNLESQRARQEAALAIASSTLSTNSGRENSLDEMFTDRSSGRPNICCHAAT